MNKKAQKAAHLLKYYFRMKAKNSGVNWDSDNDTEVEEIVELILILYAAGEYTDEAIEDHNNAQISHKMS